MILDMPPQQETTQHETITVACFNVFIGSPVPYIRNGTTALHQSTRLKLQLRQLRNIDADILVLQEIYDSTLAQEYAGFFKDQYDMCVDVCPGGCETIAGVVTFYAVALFAGILGTVAVMVIICLAIGLFAVREMPPPSWLAAVYPSEPTMVGWVLWFAFGMFAISSYQRWTGQVAWSFWHGDVKTANVILYKRNKFLLVKTWSKHFEEQRGDWLNATRPRGFIIADLSLLVNGSGRANLRVMNAHTNCQGAEGLRDAQTQEALRYAAATTGPALACGDWNQEIPEQFQQHGFSDRSCKEELSKCDTWVARNPLTNGFIRVDDLCCDHVATSRCGRVNRRIGMEGPPWTSDHLAMIATVEIPLQK